MTDIERQAYRKFPVPTTQCPTEQRLMKSLRDEYIRRKLMQQENEKKKTDA